MVAVAVPLVHAVAITRVCWMPTTSNRKTPVLVVVVASVPEAPMGLRKIVDDPYVSPEDAEIRLFQPAGDFQSQLPGSGW